MQVDEALCLVRLLLQPLSGTCHYSGLLGRESRISQPLAWRLRICGNVIRYGDRVGGRFQKSPKSVFNNRFLCISQALILRLTLIISSSCKMSTSGQPLNSSIADSWGFTKIYDPIQYTYLWIIDNVLELRGELKAPSSFSGGDGKTELLMSINSDTSIGEYTYLYVSLQAVKFTGQVQGQCEFSVFDIRERKCNVKTLPLRSSNRRCVAVCKYLSRTKLLERGLLENGRLNLFCRVTLFRNSCHQFSGSNARKRIRLDPPLNSSIEKLYKSQELSDVILCVDKQEFKAHKTILAAQSPIFKSMFSVDMRETRSGRVEITDTDPAAVREMLDFIYTEKTSIDRLPEQPNNGDLAIKVLQIADRYQVDGLKSVCEDILVRKLSKNTVGGLSNIADAYNAAYLKERARAFVKINSEDFIEPFIDSVIKAEINKDSP